MKQLLQRILISGMAVSLCALGEEASALKMMPAGLHIKYPQDGLPQKGLEAWALFTGDQVSCVWVDWEAGERIVVRDSNNKNLGTCKVENGGLLCRFVIEKFPSPGAKWIHIKGELPLKSESGREETPSVPLKVDMNEQVMAGSLKVQVTDIKHAGMEGFYGDADPSYQFRIDLTVTTRRDSGCSFERKIKLTDREGRPLPHKERPRDNSGGSATESWVTMTYLLKEQPEELNVSLVYRPVKEETIDVDLKYDLYPKDDK